MGEIARDEVVREVKKTEDGHAGTPAPAPAKKRRRSGRARARTKPPQKALRLTTYRRLAEYLEAFAKGHFHLMILVGAGGLAKSRSVRAVLGDNACWIEGNATPFGMYAKLYRHRDEFVVIDDVDALYADRSGVRLLKCLCQTEEEKAVAWHSDARSLLRQQIPREFTTRSRVVIISNDWQTLNKNVAASRIAAMCSSSSQAPPRFTRKPAHGSTIRRSISGSRRISTASGSPRFDITCGPRN